MALVTNAFTSYSGDSGSKRNREVFSDLISMITPEETPFYSLIRKESVDGTHPEWSTDTLATPVITNKSFEGDTYAFTAITPTVRVGNYCQISMKQFAITETQEVVSKAGPKSELGRERAKKGTDLRCDMEVSMLSNNASIAGAQATAPTTRWVQPARRAASTPAPASSTLRASARSVRSPRRYSTTPSS